MIHCETTCDQCMISKHHFTPQPEGGFKKHEDKEDKIPTVIIAIVNGKNRNYCLISKFSAVLEWIVCDRKDKNNQT